MSKLAAITFEFYHRILDAIRFKKRHYNLVFNKKNGSAKAVLADLARFCHMNETPYHPDSRKTDILIGRQEVFLRIQHMIELQPTDLYVLLDGRPVAQNTAPEEGDAE